MCTALVETMRNEGVSVPRNFQTEFGIPGHGARPLWAAETVENRPQVFSATISKLSQMNPWRTHVISYLLPGKRVRKKPHLFL